MNAQETLAIIEALRANGATHFKSQDFEISLIPGTQDFVSTKIQKQEPPNPEAVKAANQKISEMINTLKMTPEQLADQIFPDGAGV